MLQALHGRAPSLATGVKRTRPDLLVFTVQGDGDMVNEGLQEVVHAAARGEQVTCFMLNNGVFGETGGHMTATTVLGQRTKNTLDGRDAEAHGYPILLSNLLAGLEGVALRRPRRGQQPRERQPHQEDDPAGAAGSAAAAGLFVRRDPDHVSHRLVHRDHRGAGLPDRQGCRRCTRWAC